VRLGVLDHLLDLGLVESGAALDLDLLLLAGAEILGGDVEDSVRVDVEGDLDLGHAPRRGRDARELELAQALVAGGHLALTLEHVDLDRGLVVLGGREDLRLLVGIVVLRSISLVITPPLVSMPKVSGVTSSSQHVLDVAGQDAGLDARADRDDLVGVDALVRVLAVSSLTFSWTDGIRVMPPTRTT